MSDNHSSLAQQAADVRAARRRTGRSELERRLESLTPEKRALLRDTLQQRRAGAAIPRRPQRGPAPLSFSQQRFWFLERWQPGAPTNNGARATRLLGGLDLAALQRALGKVVERHESLRTVYRLEGREPVQVVLENWSLDLPVVDLSAHSVEDREPELGRLLRSEARGSFDLGADLMVRPTVFRLDKEEEVLLLTFHHIASDAASYRVLRHELAELYDSYRSGREPRLPELPIQYADFAVWQHARLRGKHLDDLLSYWRNALEQAPERLGLPTDRARPPVQRHEGAHLYVSFDDDLGTAVGALARREGLTVFTVLLAAFNALLYRFTGQDDVLVGSPVASRNHVELEGLIGCFANTLVLRNRLAGNPSFLELLGRVRESTSSALAHQELPFERLVEALRVSRDPSVNPVFQVNFRAQVQSEELLWLPGLTTAGSIPIDLGFSRFDLALELRVEGTGLAGYFEYDEDLFDVETIEALADTFETVLRRVVLEPETQLLSLPRVRRQQAPTTRIPRAAHH